MGRKDSELYDKNRLRERGNIWSTGYNCFILFKNMMSEEQVIKGISCLFRIGKWFALQVFLYFLMPYLWNYEYAVGTITLILLYTSLYITYWNFISKELRFRRILFPYLIYMAIAIILWGVTDHWIASIGTCILLPLYGLSCLVGIQLIRKYSKRIRKKSRFGRVISRSAIAIILILLKSLSVLWMCQDHKSLDKEKQDLFERKNYLLDKLVTSPQNVLNEMPSMIGVQFQGEWALYSCSMLSAALVNLSYLYPETKKENVLYIDSLINIVMSPEIRYYDTMRWNEDPLESLEGDNSHVSYLSHLAWMICGYKEIGGDKKYDKLLSDLCETMNRRILQSESLNLPTYPSESIYVPDMLVAIVALNQYADTHKGKYRSTVKKWIARAQKEWLDKETGILASFIDRNGNLYENAPVKGSYSALNCYYLTFIDEAFAKKQYEQLKTLFWKEGVISGLKEYWDYTCYVGIDIDAGPILFELGPSGTAFFAGSAAYFGDSNVRNEILATAEIAGHTIKIGNKRHYFLANIALVGESIMLAMRTNMK